jgi:hypothetical protein
MARVHVCGKLTQGLVKVVHLRQNATDNQDDKDICRGVGKLILACEGHLERGAEGFDSHD